MSQDTIENEAIYKTKDLEIYKLSMKRGSKVRRVVYSIIMLQSSPKKETVMVCQKFARNWVENREACCIYVDCSNVSFVLPAVIKEQAQFLEELDVVDSHRVKKVVFVAGSIASAVLRKLLEIKAPSVPYEIFTDADKAWDYVSQ